MSGNDESVEYREQTFLTELPQELEKFFKAIGKPGNEIKNHNAKSLINNASSHWREKKKSIIKKWKQAISIKHVFDEDSTTQAHEKPNAYTVDGKCKRFMNNSLAEFEQDWLTIVDIIVEVMRMNKKKSKFIENWDSSRTLIYNIWDFAATHNFKYRNVSHTTSADVLTKIQSSAEPSTSHSNGIEQRGSHSARSRDRDTSEELSIPRPKARPRPSSADAARTLREPRQQNYVAHDNSPQSTSHSKGPDMKILKRDFGSGSSFKDRTRSKHLPRSTYEKESGSRTAMSPGTDHYARTTSDSLTTLMSRTSYELEDHDESWDTEFKRTENSHVFEMEQTIEKLKTACRKLELEKEQLKKDALTVESKLNIYIDKYNKYKKQWFAANSERFDWETKYTSLISSTETSSTGIEARDRQILLLKSELEKVQGALNTTQDELREITEERNRGRHDIEEALSQKVGSDKKSLKSKKAIEERDAQIESLQNELRQTRQAFKLLVDEHENVKENMKYQQGQIRKMETKNGVIEKFSEERDVLHQELKKLKEEKASLSNQLSDRDMKESDSMRTLQKELKELRRSFQQVVDENDKANRKVEEQQRQITSLDRKLKTSNTLIEESKVSKDDREVLLQQLQKSKKKKVPTATLR